VRTRVVRDLVTISGIAVILGGMVFTNNYFGRMGLIDKFENMRKRSEELRKKQGLDVLNWDWMRSTKGSLSKGPRFVEELIHQDGTLVNLVGFIFPIEDFREMTEFMLLPLPIQCYFCEAPPARDIFLVQMEEGKTTDAFEEPVLTTGQLRLFKEPKSKFFYAIAQADVTVGTKGSELTKKNIPIQHKMHMEPMPEEKLLPALPAVPEPAPIATQ
jgi:hypothetical protein